MKLEIVYMADHLEYVPVVADWFYQEWGGRWPSATLVDFTEQLEGRLNRDRSPITFVGIQKGEPVGTAALIIREMETHTQYEYWLGSVFTREDFRGHGIASELIKAVANKASQFGIESLYLYTHGKQPLYSKFGWTVIESSTYRGKVVSIMERRVNSSTLRSKYSQCLTDYLEEKALE